MRLFEVNRFPKRGYTPGARQTLFFQVCIQVRLCVAATILILTLLEPEIGTWIGLGLSGVEAFVFAGTLTESEETWWKRNLQFLNMCVAVLFTTVMTIMQDYSVAYLTCIPFFIQLFIGVSTALAKEPWNK